MTFSEIIIRIHGDFINRELTPQDREYLGNLLEGMTNIDTSAKADVFSDLCRCYPIYDYEKLISI